MFANINKANKHIFMALHSGKYIPSFTLDVAEVMKRET